MKCENCGKDIEFYAPVFQNVEIYGGYQTATSKCCGMAYRVGRIISYDIQPYRGDDSEDSWGNPIKIKLQWKK